MLDPNDPPEIQVAKQQKIIDALIRRSNRQRDLGPSAFRAFQSALELQETVAEQTRDLQRAATDLESARYERERTRRILAEALSSMDGGFALFSDGNLELCNDLFRTLLPDIQDAVRPGLPLGQFLTLASSSEHFVSSEQPLSRLNQASNDANLSSVVIELQEDRWFQIGAQSSTDDNLILLLTEITSLVRRNRDEKENLIDRQSDYLQAVFQSMNPGICTFSESGEVMMRNGRFLEILGVPRGLVDPGAQLTDIMRFFSAHRLADSSKEMTTERWRRELQIKGRLQYRLQDKDGKVLDIQASRLPDGGFVVELTDVTLSARNTQVLEERVMERTAELTVANARLVREYDKKARVEEELRLAKERAESAVSSKTRFLAAASHDLLQPINAAKLLISTLREMTRKTESAVIVERLESAFGSAEQLLHSLLDISRLESSDPDAVTPSNMCLGPILLGIHADQTPFAEQRRVQLNVVPSSAFVNSDPVYLLRSIQNLVVNALQYTDPGGRVLFGCRRQKGKVVVEVWDTGVGIPRKDQARIFEEFARSDNVAVGSGMGLGLSVVDRACRLLGHGLKVRSKPNFGSVFSIEMDEVAPLLSRPAARAPLAAMQDQRLKYIVLVLENDGLVLDGMTRWLEQWGASVLPASLTSEALHYVEDMGIPPDIILADYQLDGDETGIDAIAKMREMTAANVPAILITANQSVQVRQEAEANDISVMHKPAKLGRLRATIDEKVRSRSVLAEGTESSVTADMQTKVAGD